MAKSTSATFSQLKNGKVSLRRESGKIWSPVRQIWLVETPEERVRQAYLPVLINEYGYGLNQIAEEVDVAGRGSAHARADFAVWRSYEDRKNSKPPLIVVECKSDNVTISPKDYSQGENYARLTNAPFFVTHNSRETRYWRVKKDRMPGYVDEIENIPDVEASDREIEELISKLKTFKEDEFADLLHKCHNVIRNREKKDPAAAFDEIAKILFVKVWVERELKHRRRRENLFSVDFLEEQIGDNPLEDLFQKTKAAYRADKIFAKDERINLKPATGSEIVKLLESYNLSGTSEDVKGIAFERFLGRTFRGEIGQFFTPREIVRFMVAMLDPKESEAICDPASGSGGFLIRFFEVVREKILADADRQYNEYRLEIEGRKAYSPTKKAELLRDKYDEIQATLDPSKTGSRMWKLSNRCIFGTDANDRMARTSKMNMIMHGDGHGGVHHWDGFLNVNGIFEERFDIVLTNPPFGASVEPSDHVVLPDDTDSEETDREYVREYGEQYKKAIAQVRAAEGKPIADLFSLPRRGRSGAKIGKIKTEVLFLERCLSLLKPGGRLGIVLPEGVFNNPSQAYVREFCEDKAFIRAVVSLPPETFISIGASVKASLLFLQKFSEREALDYAAKKRKAIEDVETKYSADIARVTTEFDERIGQARRLQDGDRERGLKNELASYLKEMEEDKKEEARELLKASFSYLVFMYEAEKVGITATGERDQNELYPNENAPPSISRTCLEVYKDFLRQPSAFLRGNG